MKILVALVQLVAVDNIAFLVAIVRVACTLPPHLLHVFLHVCHAPCYACPCMLAIYLVMNEVVPVLVVFYLYMIVADSFSFLSGLDTRSCKDGQELDRLPPDFHTENFLSPSPRP